MLRCNIKVINMKFIYFKLLVNDGLGVQMIQPGQHLLGVETQHI